ASMVSANHNCHCHCQRLKINRTAQKNTSPCWKCVSVYGSAKCCDVCGPLGSLIQNRSLPHSQNQSRPWARSSSTMSTIVATMASHGQCLRVRILCISVADLSEVGW